MIRKKFGQFVQLSHIRLVLEAGAAMNIRFTFFIARRHKETNGKYINLAAASFTCASLR